MDGSKKKLTLEEAIESFVSLYTAIGDFPEPVQRMIHAAMSRLVACLRVSQHYDVESFIRQVQLLDEGW